MSTLEMTHWKLGKKASLLLPLASLSQLAARGAPAAAAARAMHADTQL
jgi:hypothetical protein